MSIMLKKVCINVDLVITLQYEISIKLKDISDMVCMLKNNSSAWHVADMKKY